jgi:toxin ParE1/3/4
MPHFVVRPRARIDIDGIWDYIADDSVAQADAVVDRMASKFKLLARQPDLGRPRNDLMPDLRSFPFERYIIFYRPFVDGIEVLRVLHGARDVEAQFHQVG